MKKARNSVIEVYRILAMLAIVAYHYGVHGDAMGDAGGGAAQNFLLVYTSWGKWGVDAFVLIGAYFMSKSTFRWRGMRAILTQVWSTSWIILVAALIWLPDVASGATTWHAVLPVATNFYWFVTVYVMLMVLSPFINVLVNGMTQRQHLALVGILFIAWSVLYFVRDFSFGANNLTWFIELYLIAAYIARYPLRGTAKAWGASALAFGVAVPITTVLAGALLSAHPSWDVAPWMFRSQFAPFVVLSAVCGLVAVTKMRPRVSTTVNTIAGATFGVYLIHDNAFIRQVLWSDWVNTGGAAREGWLLPLHAIAVTAMVYVVATLLELARQRVVQRPLMAVGDRIFKRRE